jgi:hypothetical protein
MLEHFMPSGDSTVRLPPRAKDLFSIFSDLYSSNPISKKQGYPAAACATVAE